MTNSVLRVLGHRARRGGLCFTIATSDRFRRHVSRQRSHIRDKRRDVAIRSVYALAKRAGAHAGLGDRRAHRIGVLGQRGDVGVQRGGAFAERAGANAKPGDIAICRVGLFTQRGDFGAQTGANAKLGDIPARNDSVILGQRSDGAQRGGSVSERAGAHAGLGGVDAQQRGDGR